MADERKSADARERLREDVAFDCLFGNSDAYSKKALGRESDWERIPEGSPRGRLVTRLGKPFKLYMPVKLFYRFAAKLGLLPAEVSDFFPQKVIALKPKSGQSLCYAVEFGQGRNK